MQHSEQRWTVPQTAAVAAWSASLRRSACAPPGRAYGLLPCAAPWGPVGDECGRYSTWDGLDNNQGGHTCQGPTPSAPPRYFLQLFKANGQ